MNNHKRGQQYCTEALALNPISEFGLISKAKAELDSEEWEAAIRTLKEAEEHHESQRVQNLMQEAQVALRRSKQKDYYKVLGVSRDADERDIKRAYRKLTKQFHPDKAVAQGIPKEEAQKKMAAINEAYETLSDPELKERVDRGEDPNDPAQQQGGHPFHGSPFGQQYVFRSGPGGGFPGGGSFQFGGQQGFQFPPGFGF
jgi:DnaJ homolog subfamily C member 3